MTDTKEPHLFGTLYKKTIHNSWQKRQCYAARNKFMYFKHKINADGDSIKFREEDHPQGVISLHQSHCYIPPPDDIHISKKDFCFVLRANNKDFYFACDTKIEQSNWVSFLCSSIDELAKGKDMKIAHSFKKVSFARATICTQCESFIWGLGKNGFLCTVCHTCVHKKCIYKLGENCTTGGRAMKTRSTIFSHKDTEISDLSSSSSKELTPKEKKINELRNMLRAVEAREEQDIKETKRKFEEQLEEILEEFRTREAIDVAEVEYKYKQQRDPLMLEISLRSAAVK